MRCDACGAHNAQGAVWCTQCYASFGAEDPASSELAPSDPGPQPPATTSTDASPPVADTSEGLAPAPAEGLTSATPGSEGAGTAAEPVEPSGGRGPVEVGDVRDVDGVVEWRCHTCASWVALELATCAVCGAPRAGFGDQPRVEATLSDADRGKVLAGGAAFPGVGHLLAGRLGSGITRLTLGGLWLVLGIWWLATTTSSGNAPGVILILGAVVLWAASYLDVRSLVDGDEERFGVRGLLWLVVGVTTLLMVAVAWLATGPSIG